MVPSSPKVPWRTGKITSMSSVLVRGVMLVLALSWSGCREFAGTGGMMIASPRLRTAAVGVAWGSPARRGFAGVCWPVRRAWASSEVTQLPCLVMPMGTDVVLLGVDGLEDGGGREEGDFVLAGAAAEEDAYACFFLHVWVQVSTTFRVFVRKKVWEEETWFLLGVFAFLVCFVMVNRGEVVVDCVANVVEKLSLFGALNVGHHFWFIFGGVSELLQARDVSCLRIVVRRVEFLGRDKKAYPRG